MRGGGRGGGRRGGPTLPFKLTKELGEAGGGGRGGRCRGGRHSRKDRRREERHAKKHRPPPPPSKPRGKRPAVPEPAAAPAAKKARHSGDARGRQTDRAPARPGGSRFDELLPASRDPEKALQRELARKLGLKRGGRLGHDDDGMDELMGELGGFDDVFGSDDSGDERAPAGKKQKGKYAAASPPSDSDSGSEEVEEETDSEDEGHLGGLSELDHEHDDLGFDLDSEEESEEAGGGDDVASGAAGLTSDSEELEEGEEDDSDDEEEESEEEGGSSEEEGQESEEEGAADDDTEGEQEDERAAENEQAHTAAAPAVAPSAGKYVPPAVRRAQLAAAGAPGAGAAEEERVRRRVRGLLNRLAETNLPGIVGDLAGLYGSEGRSVVAGAVAAELLAAAAEGPRASERFAAVAAAAVAGLAGMANSPGVIAAFLAAVAPALEASLSGDAPDALAASNLVRVVAHLFLAGAIKADLVFSLLDSWRERFSEADVAAIAGLLGVAGLPLRSADPERMKEFVVAVHARAGKEKALSVRARVMLDLVVDVKNNRQRGGGVALDAAAAKWLRGCGVGGVAVGGITWGKALSGDKRGTWWEPSAADAAAALAAARAAAGGGAGASASAAAAAAAAGAGADAGLAAPELLRLAAAMRMNTDSRRAVFCAVMGSEDAVDAHEKLLRLGLRGDQEREAVRVTVECAAQEAAYNPYYAQLLARLCASGKSHRITLQYCLWDHFKEVTTAPVRRLTNLARLAGAVVAGFSVPSTMLKAVDFAAAMSAREVLFWRLFFEAALSGVRTDADAAALAGRIASQPTLAGLKVALGAFLKRQVGPWLASKDPEDPASGGAERLATLLRRCRLAERTLLGRI